MAYLGILNDYDRPEAAMLIVVWQGRGCWRGEYINPAKPRLNGKFITFPSHFTGLAAFGMFANVLSDGRLYVAYLDRSVAQYHDGMPRRWQGEGRWSVAIRPQLLSKVQSATMESAKFAFTFLRMQEAA